MRSGLIALADIKAASTASGAGVPLPSRRTRQFQQFSPIFPVRDLAAALRHYAALGFKTFAYEGGGDYGFANRDRLSIHLTLDPGHEPGRPTSTCGTPTPSTRSGPSPVSAASPAPSNRCRTGSARAPTSIRTATSYGSDHRTRKRNKDGRIPYVRRRPYRRTRS